jgi:hypothetical protein
MGIWISSVTGWVADLVSGGAAGRGRSTRFVIEPGARRDPPNLDADGMLGDPGDAGPADQSNSIR